MLAMDDDGGRCLRCQGAVGDGEVTCRACGASRDVERRVHGTLIASRAAVRTWLAIVGVLALAAGIVEIWAQRGVAGQVDAMTGYGAYSDGGMLSTAASAVVVGYWLIAAGVALLLCRLAIRLFPTAAPALALLVIAVSSPVVRDPGIATPFYWVAHGLIAAALVAALLLPLRARRLRRAFSSSGV